LVISMRIIFASVDASRMPRKQRGGRKTQGGGARQRPTA
jgi:hypothetical protein